MCVLVGKFSILLVYPIVDINLSNKVKHMSNETTLNLAEEFVRAMDIANEMDELVDQMFELDYGYEIYSSIVDTIHSCGGVTKSLESMFGENFTSSDKMLEESSMEADGIISKAINTIKEFFRKLWAWFQSIFKGNDGVIAALREAKTKVDQKANIFPLKVNHAFLYENGWVNKMVTGTFAGIEQTVDQKDTKTGDAWYQKAGSFISGGRLGQVKRDDIVNKSAEGDTIFGGAFMIENPDQFKNACDCLISALDAIKSSEQSFKKLEGEIEQEAASNGEKQGFITKKLLTAKAWARVRLINARVRAGAMYLVNRVG